MLNVDYENNFFLYASLSETGLIRLDHMNVKTVMKLLCGFFSKVICTFFFLVMKIVWKEINNFQVVNNGFLLNTLVVWYITKQGLNKTTKVRESCQPYFQFFNGCTSTFTVHVYLLLQ